MDFINIFNICILTQAWISSVMNSTIESDTIFPYISFFSYIN